MLPIPPSPRSSVLLALLALPGGLSGCAASPRTAPDAAVATAPPSTTSAPSPRAQASTSSGCPSLRLAFLGQGRLPTGLRFGDTEVGGLSALVYDRDREVFLALSDDRGTESSRGPARLYTLEIGVEDADGSAEVDLRVTGVTVLRERDGEPFRPGTLDPEGLALTPTGTLLIASEGDADRGVAPFLREMDREGRSLRSFAVPDACLPGDGTGVRSNLGFEALTRTPDFSAVFTATENALVQDGPEADLGRRSPARLLRFEPTTGRPVAEYLYVTDPVRVPPLPPTGRRGTGLVELVALDASRFLALERSYSEGMGVTARLFVASLDRATEITGRAAVDPGRIRPVTKSLLMDLADLGVPLDNLEALAWGPDLPDGRRSLLILSDNNFNPLQITQLLVFAVEPCP